VSISLFTSTISIKTISYIVAFLLLYFSLLKSTVGPEGKIIGVDITDRMLQQAEERVVRNGWANIDLVKSDAAEFRFPQDVDGIISTFAITLCPEFDKVILNGCKSLKPGRRWVILDLKMPDNWLSFFTPLFIFLSRPFGVTEDLITRHPWESLNKYFKNFTMTELYKGVAYIAVGEKG